MMSVRYDTVAMIIVGGVLIGICAGILVPLMRATSTLHHENRVTRFVHHLQVNSLPSHPVQQLPSLLVVSEDLVTVFSAVERVADERGAQVQFHVLEKKDYVSARTRLRGTPVSSPSSKQRSKERATYRAVGAQHFVQMTVTGTLDHVIAVIHAMEANVVGIVDVALVERASQFDNTEATTQATVLMRIPLKESPSNHSNT